MFPRKRALHEPNRTERVNDISFPTTHAGSPVVSRGDGLMVLVSLFLVVLPLWQDPIPQLLAFAVSGLGVPLYCVFIMEEPCRLRPKFVDRFSTWLVLTTSNVFNTELSTKI